jgi:hypothetical protein
MEKFRSGSSMSSYTIRPSPSPVIEVSSEPSKALSDDHSFVFPEMDVSAAADELLEKLRITSPSSTHDTTAKNLEFLDGILHDISHCSEVISLHFSNRVQELRTELMSAGKQCRELNSQVRLVQSLTDKRLSDKNLRAFNPKGKRGSEDSETTMCSSNAKISAVHLPLSKSTHRSVATQTTDRTLTRKNSGTLTQWLENLLPKPTSSYKSQVDALTEIKREIYDLQTTKRVDRVKLGPGEKKARLKHLLKKKAKQEERLLILERQMPLQMSAPTGTKGGVARALFVDPDEKSCAVGREVKSETPPPKHSVQGAVEGCIERSLMTTGFVFEAVLRDLQGVEHLLSSVCPSFFHTHLL